MAGHINQSVFNTLGQHRLVPVISLPHATQAAPLADVLVEGGLPVAEVTFRTEAAAESIKIMADRGDMLVGAGTVLTINQVDQARDAGASFVVAPGLNPRIVEHCLNTGMTVCPGIATPSDIEVALGYGLEVVKFFPAEAYGGLKTLKAISAPYGMMRFMPTGGIGPANVMDYLGFSRVIACGGSWMVGKEMIEVGDFEGIKHQVTEAIKLCQTK